MDNSIKIVSPSKARKRPYIRLRRVKEERGKIRYSTDQPPIKPTCGHNTKSYKCSKLNSNDVLFFDRVFYATNDKIKQENFILKHVISTTIRRRRAKTGNKPGRLMALKYFIRKKKDRTLIPVCKKALLGILNLKKGRRELTEKRLPIGVPVNEAKLNDVRKLLVTYFGQDWVSLMELNYYKKVLNSENVIGRPMHEEEIEEDDSEEILNFV